MSPELSLLAILLVFIGFAYLVAYPLLQARTPGRLFAYDMVITAATLGLGWMLFGGQGIGFSLIFFDVPWWLFMAVTGLAIEVPVFAWYCRRHGIPLVPPLDDGT